MSISGVNTYNSVFHGIPQHHRNPVSLSHALRLQAPSKSIASGIQLGVGNSVILVFGDNTGKTIESVHPSVHVRQLVYNPRRPVPVFPDNTSEMISDGRFEQRGLYTNNLLVST